MCFWRFFVFAALVPGNLERSKSVIRTQPAASDVTRWFHLINQRTAETLVPLKSASRLVIMAIIGTRSRGADLCTKIGPHSGRIVVDQHPYSEFSVISISLFHVRADMLRPSRKGRVDMLS